MDIARWEVNKFGRALTNEERNSQREHDVHEDRKDELVRLARSRALTASEFAEFARYSESILTRMNWMTNGCSSGSYNAQERSLKYLCVLQTQQIFQTLAVQQMNQSMKGEPTETK